MPFTGRQFEELYDELDKNKTGVIKYNIFIDQVSITKMYLNELELYNTLLTKEPEGVGGVTIKEMKKILETDFNFPDQTLKAAFKQMLNADIDSIDPECIIDTRKFIDSLHKEFEAVAQKSISAT